MQKSVETRIPPSGAGDGRDATIPDRASDRTRKLDRRLTHILSVALAGLWFLYLPLHAWVLYGIGVHLSGTIWDTSPTIYSSILSEAAMVTGISLPLLFAIAIRRARNFRDRGLYALSIVQLLLPFAPYAVFMLANLLFA
jgi:hypothetical protein